MGGGQGLTFFMNDWQIYNLMRNVVTHSSASACTCSTSAGDAVMNKALFTLGM